MVEPVGGDLWEREDIEKLLRSIDRGSLSGKRDYAVILLVVQLGLRISDVPQLNTTIPVIYGIRGLKPGPLNVSPNRCLLWSRSTTYMTIAESIRVVRTVQPMRRHVCLGLIRRERIMPVITKASNSSRTGSTDLLI